MPVISSFTISNFKGIEKVKLDMSDRAKCPVITLIGLNESGKTTILEALSHFVSGDKAVASLFDGIHLKSTGAALIPVNKKAAFTSWIEVAARVTLDLDDLKIIKEIATKHKQVLDEEILKEAFIVKKQLTFEDSALKKSANIWSIKLVVKAKGKAKAKRVTDAEPLWRAIVSHLSENIAQINYFPTFLVDMPNRIYLREYEKEPSVNRYYRHVMQDILDSLGESISLEKHVCNRIDSFKDSESNPGWFSILMGSPIKAQIDSVFQKISNAVTKEVLGSWQRVFQRPISAKSIIVEWNIDTEKGNIPYASFYVTDGESRYAISERSLGFRWFFSFLLFTAFKQNKKRKTIFVFDEPAANLHAKAQAELLTSFEKIASDGNVVIYSTHSHHMIEPKWLSGAYIVENTALDYDSEDSFDLSSKPTNIKITKYREFASQSPSRSSYFQPVIEKLQYVNPLLIGSAPFAIVEGITDYFALRLATFLSASKYGFSLIPGSGAGASAPLISLLLGRGEKFVIILDDDKAGKKEQKRYCDEWFLSDSDVITLEKVDKKFEGKQLEGLLDENILEKISERNSGEKPTKKQIGWFLSEACADVTSRDGIERDSLKDFILVLDFLQKKLVH